MYRIAILLIVLLLASCHNKNPNLFLGKSTGYSEQSDFSGDLLMEEEPIENPRTAEPPPPPEEYTIEKGSKIIKNGNMKFEVTDLESVKSRIDSSLRSVNAYYENEQFNDYSNRSSYSLAIRIPNAKFDSLINDFESGIGKLTTKNIQAKDATEEYVDLNIRLVNNLMYLTQYRSILAKAKSIKEILEIQEMIRRIEEEIESKKGRIKYLDDRVSFSTLNLEITELNTLVISDNPSYFLRTGNAFMSGIEGFLEFTIAVVHVWPLILFLGLLIGFREIIFRVFTLRRIRE